jgi:hypothetical protein
MPTVSIAASAAGRLRKVTSSSTSTTANTAGTVNFRVRDSAPAVAARTGRVPVIHTGAPGASSSTTAWMRPERSSAAYCSGDRSSMLSANAAVVPSSETSVPRYSGLCSSWRGNSAMRPGSARACSVNEATLRSSPAAIRFGAVARDSTALTPGSRRKRSVRASMRVRCSAENTLGVKRTATITGSSSPKVWRICCSTARSALSTGSSASADGSTLKRGAKLRGSKHSAAAASVISSAAAITSRGCRAIQRCTTKNTASAVSSPGSLSPDPAARGTSERKAPRTLVRRTPRSPGDQPKAGGSAAQGATRNDRGSIATDRSGGPRSQTRQSAQNPLYGLH